MYHSWYGKKGNKMVEMTKEILDVIHAVLDYKKFVISENRVKKTLSMQMFDAEELAMAYYCSLPLPVGMERNNIDFDRILSFERDGGISLYTLDHTEERNLHNYIWK